MIVGFMCAAKMHADEADIDVTLVRKLVTAQFPQWSSLAVEPVESSGTDNAMYRLGADMAVRLPRIKSAVERRHEWLARLALLLPVAIPTVLGHGKPAFGYPWDWTVVRWLPGENPVVGQIAEPALLAKDLASFITELREIDPTDGPPQGRGVPLATRDAPTRRAIRESQGLIDTESVTTMWDDTCRLPEWSGPATWAHGDLSPGNVLVADGRLSAVIDVSGMGVGDPTVDLIVAWNLLPVQARDTFRAALRVDDVTWERGRGWALSIALIQLPYYQHTNPALAANSRHVIGEVLADAQR
jgi:aminoglycoside phosphotransferase (APT) family kinase protein